MPVRLALASLLGATQVPVPPAPAAVQWTAPQECPDAAFVRTEIARRLGRALADGEATLVAEVVRAGARGYVLHLRLSAGERSETRDIADWSCQALAVVAALRVVAAAAAPMPVADVPDAVIGVEPAPEIARTEVADAPVPAPAPAPVVAGIIPLRTGGFLRLEGGGVLGAVPGPTGAVGLAGGLLGRRWRAELRGAVVAPRTVTRPLGALQAGLYAGAVRGCGRLGQGALEVPLCVGLEAGAMRGALRAPAGPAAVAGWLAVTFGPGLVWHAGRRWGLWAGLDLVLALVRPRFELGEGARAVPLFRPAAVSGRLWLGVELRFADPW